MNYLWNFHFSIEILEENNFLHDGGDMFIDGTIEHK